MNGRQSVLSLRLVVSTVAASVAIASPSKSAESAPPVPFPSEIFQDSKSWDSPAFKTLWKPQSSPSHLSHRTFPGRPAFFGHHPHAVTALFEGDQITSISILFLDSGTWYGYVPKSARDNARTKQDQFDLLYERILQDVTGGLEKLTGEDGDETVIGKEALLRHDALIYKNEDISLRLVTEPGHLIKLILFRSADAARNLRDPRIANMSSREKADFFISRVRKNDNGDVTLAEVPVFPQGSRAYCGVSTLAMATQYLGLRLETEELAAASGIRYGSTAGSKIKEIYLAAGEEADSRLSRSTSFDFDSARKTIDAGLPVIVWRKFTFERNYVHETFPKRFANDPAATLPEPDESDRATWPNDQTGGNHASLITGYNSDRREVIFTESWGEFARDRRMRIEEMEGTAYYAFYPRP
ncbi:MAG: C39 family peptidase [Verrucomicrobiota bacterium]